MFEFYIDTARLSLRGVERTARAAEKSSGKKR